MHVLIIGGTSGLGFELAKQFKGKGWDVTVTGRSQKTDAFHFYEFEIGLDAEDITMGVTGILYEIQDILLKDIDLLVYAAGFYQEGHIDNLDYDDICEMINVGLTAPAFLLSSILFTQKKLGGFIAITSTSQITPRELEPMYTAVKAGLGMLAHSVSLDERVGKVLVASPAGILTNFWKGAPRSGELLDPTWAATQIIQLYGEHFRYQHALILREPPRIEVIKIEE